MAPIYHANIVSIIPHYDLGRPANAVNVLHWTYVGTPLTGAALTAIQSAFDTAWLAGWRPLASQNQFYTGSWVVDNSSATGGQRTNAAFTPVAGNVTGGAVGDQVAALISLHGFTRYRGGHSRIYIPGLAASIVNSDGSSLPTATTNLMNTLWNGTVSAMNGISGPNGGPLTPVIWHKKWTGHENTTEDIASFTSQSLLATQRRRLRKVSRHRARALP